MNKLGSLLLIMSIDWLLRLAEYFETYIFKDWDFVKYLIILVIMDTLVGVYRVRKQNKFSWKKLGKIVDKLISYVSILVLVHVITSFTVDNQTVTLFYWMKVIVLSGLMIKEGYSVLKNVAAINKRYVPVWLLKQFEIFDKTGRFVIEDENKL